MLEAAPPPDERCPRCGGTFHCGAADPGDAGPCACTTLKLDEELLGLLRQRWRGCLCLACLAALAGGESLDPGSG